MFKWCGKLVRTDKIMDQKTIYECYIAPRVEHSLKLSISCTLLTFKPYKRLK